MGGGGLISQRLFLTCQFLMLDIKSKALGLFRGFRHQSFPRPFPGLCFIIFGKLIPSLSNCQLIFPSSLFLIYLPVFFVPPTRLPQSLPSSTFIPSSIKRIYSSGSVAASPFSDLRFSALFHRVVVYKKPFAFGAEERRRLMK